MRRRDFVWAASAGLAGASIPRLGRATACPIPTVSIQKGQTVLTPCTPTQVGPAPAWWKALPAGQWAAIASTGTLSAAAPPTLVGDSDTGQKAIISAWNGATVDQANRRFILLANGGHGDYAGNEGYRLDLGSEAPGWQRFIDPTPNASITYSDSYSGSFALNADGRPRSMHTSGFQCLGDGYIWYPYCNSFSSPSGGSLPGVAAFNMNNGAVAAAMATNVPLAWDGTVGPWLFFGAIGGPISGDIHTGAASFGVAAFDRVGHRVFGLGGLGSDRTNTFVWCVGTQAGSLGSSVSYLLNGGNPYADFRWAVCAYDLNILVAADGENGRIIVFDLANVGGSGWYTAIASGQVSGSGYYGGGVGGPFPGAGYVAANHTIAVGDPPNIGGKIYKLQIPTKVSSGNTVYDPSGTWAWTSITPGGAALTYPDDTKPYTRFNLIENMGDNTAALIYVGGVSAPTYVYKIPATGV